MNLDQITTALHSPDEELRLQGLRELAARGAEVNLELIFEAFADGSWRVRKLAIEIFLELPIRRDRIGAVMDLLHAEENAGLRNAAVEILSRMGREAVPRLIDQARCSDQDVRKFIIDILGDIGAPEAIPILILGLEDDDSNVRAAAAENLGKLRAAEAVPALVKAMKQPDLLLQFTILDALSRIAEPVPLVELLPYRQEKLLRKAMVDCLSKAGDASAVPELVAALTDTMRNVRESAVLAVVTIYDRYPAEVRAALAGCEQGPVAAMLAGCLDEACHDPLKRAAIKVLGWLAADDAVPRLLALLEYESLQQSAIDALVDIGRTCPQRLMEAWPAMKGPSRAYLAYVLGESECAAALSLLKDALGDNDLQVVRMAVYALGKIASVTILDDLVACLQSDDSEVQQAACQALISLGEEHPSETFAALQPLLGHHAVEQRRLAVLVLRELDTPEVLNVLSLAMKDSAAEIRRAAVKVFERHDMEEHLSALMIALTDEDADVRRTAVEVLAGCDDEQALDGLQLALQDEDIWVRSTAVRGLGRMGGDRSRALVEQALKDPVGLVSIAALETLDDLTGAKALPQVLAALDHADEEVVTAAMHLLARYPAGDWVCDHGERLINHPFWAVRTHIARSAAALLGPAARELLEKRLATESEDVVREQLKDLLATLPAV